jgi:hypothetical protein
MRELKFAGASSSDYLVMLAGLVCAAQGARLHTSQANLSATQLQHGKRGDSRSTQC